MVLQILLLYKLAYAQAITITAQCPLYGMFKLYSVYKCKCFGIEKQELSQY